ncbi:methylated-DNA--[protein]-cysteine S-methyltransferase [Streptosporangium canum]|uniref:methylated-DNA--[protein]-cysteine S-methyltransferase n=1 Tax=Streptosporangium canum TaxID=324952 RepID=UPI00342FF4BD
MRTHTMIDSPIGVLTLVATDGTLSGIYLENHLHMPHPSTFGAKNTSGFEEATEQLTEYFAGRRQTFTLPTHLAGSPFQRRIWHTLTTIAYGHTLTYAHLAETIGRPEAIRAVGAANGKNPISIVVPCHRVVGSDGALTGFSGGLARKRFLLDLEHPAAPRQGQLF